MSFVRPAAAVILRRWAEPAVALGTVLGGLWLASLGGYLLTPLGAALMLVGAGGLLIALRRLRFQRPGSAPGVVELDEGQIGYLGPSFGGYLALRELTEVRLLRLHGQAHWRLKQDDGQVLLIPHGASGAEVLFDAFATLPGVDMAAFTAALDRRDESQTLWSRPARLAARP